MARHMRMRHLFLEKDFDLVQVGHGLGLSKILHICMVLHISRRAFQKVRLIIEPTLKWVGCIESEMAQSLDLFAAFVRPRLKSNSWPITVERNIVVCFEVMIRTTFQSASRQELNLGLVPRSIIKEKLASVFWPRELEPVVTML